eukprot:CAMPEP_0206245932 /NCGR_PEP_ID=MMETSP0047_2-20121206/18971_1 /ASSEMBLY_ACC=CAM_ASM_000192 /TAXON_ID=195065 /ORGANISM="Chroomonas mesostigmatica_cf, Strain CCMP1168" /LENGTH=66 /DNA_ID=CAMNT_0053671285 /DNA_START=68 /DNA_END=268 /DNA_ORIENTATION=-
MVVQTTGGVAMRNMVYNTFFKRNSTTLMFVLGGAITGEYVVNKVFDDMWESANKGKLSKDILPKDE